MTKPLILVTNDDGVTSPGIRALVEVAKKLGEVVVVAPDQARSGMGHAITLRNSAKFFIQNQWAMLLSSGISLNFL